MDAVNSTDPTRRLVDEGARLLAEHGVAGLSLRKLAAAVGTSTMAVYTRFGDKDRLLAAMYADGFRRLAERMAAAARDPEAGLAGLGRAYRSSALDNPHLYWLMFGPLPVGFTPGDAADDVAGQSYAPLVGGVRAAVEADVLVGDPERIALHLWAVVHGMVSLELSGRLPVPADAAARAYDDALLLAATPFLARP